MLRCLTLPCYFVAVHLVRLMLQAARPTLSPALLPCAPLSRTTVCPKLSDKVPNFFVTAHNF